MDIYLYKMETIYHIADVHIQKQIDRHEEYNEVFDKLITIIKNDKSSKIVVICGDLYHDKTLISPESLTLAQKLIINIGNICDVILFDGNHDINMNNDKRMSAIEATIENLTTINKIHYLNKNKIYKIKGINFGLTLVDHNIVTPIENKNPEELYIGLYHGTLYKSRTDMNHEFTDDTKIKASDFKDYSLVLLGDIHKFQYMNKEKTIAYSSSLIQQNYGEDEKNHGMLKWNLQTLTSEFISIPNNYLYKTHLITDITNYEINGLKDKITNLRLKHNNLSRDEVLKYQHEIEKKYKIKNIILDNIINPVVKEKLNNINEEIKIIDVYKNFIDELSVKDKNYKIKDTPEYKLLIDKLITMIDSHHDMIGKDRREMKLINLEFDNLFTYGKGNKINFEEMTDLNILVGKNGLGKSSIIDILLFTLYNKFSRGSGKDALNINETKGQSTLLIKLNNEIYKIKRSITIKNTIVEIFKKENDNYININGTTKIETEEIIRKLIGNYKEMISTSIIIQRGSDFTDETDNEKKKILSNFLGLDIYTLIQDECASESRTLMSSTLKNIEKQLTHKNYKELLYDLDDELEMAEESSEGIHKEIIELSKEESMINQKISNNKYLNIDDLIKKEVTIKNKINEANNKIKMYPDIDEHKIHEANDEIQLKIKNLLKNIITVNKFKLVDEEKNEIKKLSEEIIKKKSNIQESEIIQEDLMLSLNLDKNVNLTNEIVILTTGIAIINEQLKNQKKNKKLLEMLENKNQHLINHKFNSNCNECTNNLKIHEQMGYKDEIEQLKLVPIINDNINKYENKIKLLKELLETNNKLSTLNNSIETIKQRIEEKESNIILIEKNKLINSEINEFEKELIKNKNKLIQSKEKRELKNNINKLENLNEETQKNILIFQEIEDEIIRSKELEIEYNKLKIQKNEYNKMEQGIRYNKIILEKEFENQKRLNEEYKEKINKYNVLRNIIKLYENDFFDYVMRKKIVMLVIQMNNILLNLANFEIKMEITKNTAVFYKIIEDKIINVNSLCGYEKIVFNMGMRLALNNMNVVLKNNFMIIDEGFTGADSDNIYKIPYLLDIIKKEYTMCLLISHLEDIKNQDGNKIKIKIKEKEVGKNRSYINTYIK